MDFLNELNERQREAAETLTGPLLIVAGAGSGKTRTLTYRIANVIGKGLAKPWQILAVTFTNKAAGEMGSRISNLLREQFAHLGENERPLIGTFHSICVRILRKHFDKFGRESSFVIYDDTDQLGLMKRIFKDRNIDDERMKPTTVLHQISAAKNRLQEVGSFRSTASSYFDRLVADLYEEYEKRLAASNALDFDDLLFYVNRLFRKFPAVLEEYQERWRYINVDEYQDTNHSQYQIIKMLAEKYRNLCVIGDSDQSIYSFRGADIRNILDFEKDYSEAKIVKLEQNYRSTQTILKAANAVIDQNKDRKPKDMWTENHAGDPVEVWHLSSEHEEAEKVVQEIRRLGREGAALSEIVILYRTNAQSRLIEEALLKFGLPYRVVGGVKFYARKEIKDLLAYLRVIANPMDTESLLRIINVPARSIGDGTIQKLQGFALARTLSLGEVLKHIEMVSELTPRAKSSLSSFSALIAQWQDMARTTGVSKLIADIIEKIRYRQYLDDGTEQGSMRVDNVMELLTVAKKYDGLDPMESLRSFLEEVALVQETDKLQQGASALTLMTLHAVKGLEFPYVFMVGCEEGLFPHARTLFDDVQMEEERRLMYVGVTRAMKRLYLVAARERTIFGDRQSNMISRFIEDIPEDLVKWEGRGQSGYDAETKVSPYDDLAYEKSEMARPETAEEKFKDGDKVLHGTFGEGIVVSRKGDLVTVAFENPLYGIKKFAANIAPLEKMM
jgi:DNA helicase-2/ATP-dependent DNA helicase PcrA